MESLLPVTPMLRGRRIARYAIAAYRVMHCAIAPRGKTIDRRA